MRIGPVGTSRRNRSGVSSRIGRGAGPDCSKRNGCGVNGFDSSARQSRSETDRMKKKNKDFTSVHDSGAINSAKLQTVIVEGKWACIQPGNSCVISKKKCRLHGSGRSEQKLPIQPSLYVHSKPLHNSERAAWHASASRLTRSSCLSHKRKDILEQLHKNCSRPFRQNANGVPALSPWLARRRSAYLGTIRPFVFNPERIASLPVAPTATTFFKPL
jgi:hypothetical protein